MARSDRLGWHAERAEVGKRRHFDRGIAILCVRWYLRFKLRLRDLVEMMAERGLSMARVDETYVKIRGEWCYLYRAVDRSGGQSTSG